MIVTSLVLIKSSNYVSLLMGINPHTFIWLEVRVPVLSKHASLTLPAMIVFEGFIPKIPFFRSLIKENV